MACTESAFVSNGNLLAHRLHFTVFDGNFFYARTDGKTGGTSAMGTATG
jgi:hypothetical protein